MIEKMEMLRVVGGYFQLFCIFKYALKTEDCVSETEIKHQCTGVNQWLTKTNQTIINSVVIVMVIMLNQG